MWRLYVAAVCFRRKREVSISDDGDRSSLARTGNVSQGRTGKGVGLQGISQGGVRKIAISDRLTPREISLLLGREVKARGDDS